MYAVLTGGANIGDSFSVQVLKRYVNRSGRTTVVSTRALWQDTMSQSTSSTRYVGPLESYDDPVVGIAQITAKAVLHTAWVFYEDQALLVTITVIQGAISAVFQGVWEKWRLPDEVSLNRLT